MRKNNINNTGRAKQMVVIGKTYPTDWEPGSLNKFLNESVDMKNDNAHVINEVKILGSSNFQNSNPQMGIAENVTKTRIPIIN